ncbi:hypothetical protein H257_07491 [Aphanomyces astaci]|uniref:Uncharacterized protein n=1 Tax=Aphanomyces astaci TaxID=112090 RepID=W4GIF2_APHAT|nr:hypothetical protein H257_07491 [Aphanomyces astaci]ETV79495.1 hypothetical protein H257_07491 [Aphanomyces astaci]|eukprot:XP_009831336.1 hypothetical protein H257_07491 [Aphanomyces astaci]
MSHMLMNTTTGAHVCVLPTASTLACIHGLPMFSPLAVEADTSIDQRLGDSVHVARRFQTLRRRTYRQVPAAVVYSDMTWRTGPSSAVAPVVSSCKVPSQLCRKKRAVAQSFRSAGLHRGRPAAYKALHDEAVGGASSDVYVVC